MSGVVVATVVILALGVAVAGGYPVTTWVLKLSIGSAEPPDGVPVLRGGSWIGILERFAVTGTILAGYPEGIAVVTAVKGLGRFPELRAATGATASERFIIGTLTSFCWAGAVGVGAHHLLRTLG